MHKFLAFPALLAALAFAAPAQAAVLTSLDRATFQASAGALTVQDFDALTPGNTLTFDGNVTYSTNGGTPLVTSSFITSTGANGLGATNFGFFAPSHTLTLTFATAISAFAIDINTFANTNGAYSVLLNTGDQAFSIFEVFPGRGTGQFIGFVSDTAFSSLTLSSNGFSYTVDTLLYGEERNVIRGVPEPMTWAMLVLAFGVVGASMRARRTVRVAFG